ncbi:erythromycin esterase family protein [uncultured Mucilaginibacter sp.]|uniref:erythromycin esterase family protein n=1 Tax=uncultured Mucilaginibacter sp. TaxID=797541 RepID=UPI00262C3F09|nr:erythromycin esterase family protein [uncultured Mucilaginibacter sp.]
MMPNKKQYFTICFILSLCLSCLNVVAQKNLISSLNEAVIPLQTTKADSSFGDLQKLDKVIAEKRIVALGEATHGTSEFFTTKERMIKYLITVYGFKTIVFEADFAGTFAMNDYVLYGKGTVKEGFSKMILGIYYNKEFLNLVEWVRNYNLNKPTGDQVKFYGCDMQFAFNSGETLKGKLTKLGISLSPQAAKGLEFITRWAFVKPDKETLSLLESLKTELSASIAGDIPSKRSADHQIINSVIQTIDYAKAAPLQYNLNIIRDKYMADNISWIYDHENQNKTIIWAHNQHIAKDVTLNNNLPMGYYVNEKFGAGYYAMGFGFNSGYLSGWSSEQRKSVIYTIPNVQLKNSSDFVFAQVSAPNFIIDFGSASTDPVIKQFLNTKVYSRAIGGTYVEKLHADGKGTYQMLNKMYDAIIFIRNTTASTPLK